MMDINIEELKARLQDCDPHETPAHAWHLIVAAEKAIDRLQAENAALKRELEEARNPTPEMTEAGAEYLFGHPKKKAVEFCKEEKFESCEYQAEQVFKAMSAASQQQG